MPAIDGRISPMFVDLDQHPRERHPAGGFQREAGLSANRPQPVTATEGSPTLVLGLQDMLTASGSAGHAFVRQLADTRVPHDTLADEIGRAACRERVWRYV